MKEKINNYNEEEQLKTLVNNRGLKSTRRMQCLVRNNIAALKEKEGRLIEDRDRMIKRCEEFYTELCSTRRPQDQPFINSHYMVTGPLPPILPSEVRNAILLERTISLLSFYRMGENLFTKLFNRCIVEGKVLGCWKNGSVIIIHKKGGTADIKNYRSFACNVQSVFTNPAS